MELALSFSDADAARIKNYVAKKNMSIIDYAKRAVMKPIDEEESLAAQNDNYAAKIEESRRQFAEGGLLQKHGRSWSSLPMNKQFSDQAWCELVEWVHEDRKIVDKIMICFATSKETAQPKEWASPNI